MKRSASPSSLDEEFRQRMRQEASLRMLQLTKPQSEPSEPKAAFVLNTEITETEKGFTKDFEINDIKYRMSLTRAETKADIAKYSGTQVLSIGKYYPDKSLATSAAPPLYLQINGPTKDSIQMALRRIKAILREAERPKPVPELKIFERKRFESNVAVGMKPVGGFSLRHKIIGPSGTFIKHIAAETGAKIQLKGIGSSFLEGPDKKERQEPMFLHVVAPNEAALEKAVLLCRDLLATVQKEYDTFMDLKEQYNQYLSSSQ